MLLAVRIAFLPTRLGCKIKEKDGHRATMLQDDIWLAEFYACLVSRHSRVVLNIAHRKPKISGFTDSQLEAKSQTG